MSSVADKYGQLVERLYKRTIDGRVSWEYEPTIPFLYTTVADREIEIDNGENENQEPVISIIVRSGKDQLEKFSDETLSNRIPNIKGFNSYYQLLVALQEAAKRQAVGADKSLDAILDELDDEIPF